MLPNRPSLKKLLLCACITSSFSAFAGEITITTKFGDVQVNDNANRVVALSEDALDNALALGLKPLGAVATRGGDTVSEYLQNRAEGISIVGTSRQNNLEAIASKRPDLILASATLSKEQYDILSKIAPTVAPVSPGIVLGSWMTISRSYAKALNKSEEMEAILNQVKSRQNELKTKVTAQLPEGKRTSTIARWMPQGPIVMSASLFANDVIAATGFDVTDAGLVKESRPHSSPLSLENLTKIDSDWLFLATLNTEGKDALEAARKSPAFSRLNVAKQDHVVTVNGQLWSSSAGPLAAQAILDDIENTLKTKMQ